MKLREFMLDPDLCGDAFQGDSWLAHRVIASLYDGDAHLLPENEQAMARQLIGSDVMPCEPPKVLGIGAGRRSGKTRLCSVLLVHASAQDYRDRLAPGEWATSVVVAPDRRQAKTLFDYALGLVEASPLLSAEVVRTTADTVEFSHRSRFEVHTSSFRSVRGYTMPLAVIDEAAFLRDENSASPDVELYRALIPATATLNGRLVAISSLHRKRGLMSDLHNKFHGRVAA
jgi:hypothetical protein